MRALIHRADCGSRSKCRWRALASAMAGAALVSAAACVVAAEGEEAPAPPAEAPKIAPENSAEDWAELARQLDADAFAERQQASRKLAEGGAAALPALIPAAQSDSRETRARALELIGDLFQSADPQVKAQAKAALDQIAAGGHALASRAAKNILEPPAEPPPRAQPFGFAPIQIQGQIQIRVANGNARRLQIQVNNGVKQIEAEEDGQKIKIVEDPAKGIQIEIRRKNKDGQEEIQKHEAKNLDDLRKKDPEAAKIFEKYGQNNGGLQIQGIQIQGFPQPQQPQPPQVPLPDDLRKRIEELRRRNREQLERMQKEHEQRRLEFQKQFERQLPRFAPGDAPRLEDEPPAPPAEHNALPVERAPRDVRRAQADIFDHQLELARRRLREAEEQADAAAQRLRAAEAQPRGGPEGDTDRLRAKIDAANARVRAEHYRHMAESLERTRDIVLKSLLPAEAP